MTKLDPTTFRSGDIVHVRGKVIDLEHNRQIINVDFDGDAMPIGPYEIVAHFPAIRSWSEIEGRLTSMLDDLGPSTRSDTSQAIIALLNEIDPKGDV